MAKVATVFVQESPTKLVGTSFELAALESRTFSAPPQGRHRKQFIVTVGDANQDLFLSLGKPADPANPKGSDRMMFLPQLHSSVPTRTVIESSDEITLFNPGPFKCEPIHVLEILYNGAGDMVV
jgi:hypothetical protein